MPLALETCDRHATAALKYLRGLAGKQAEWLEENGERAASELVLRWGCRLSVALQRSNCLRLRSAVGARPRTQARDLAASLAG